MTICLLSGRKKKMPEIEDELPSAVRGPAYPYISLTKVMERIEKVNADGLTRMEVNPVSYYKSWGYNKENGNARQTLAALNQFGLVEYIGRGKDRKVKLSKLAMRILLDKIPGSLSRLAAIQECAIKPAVYLALWTKFDRSLVPDHVFETHLTLEMEFSQESARKVIAGYRDTYAFAKLDELDTQTDDAPEIEPAAAAQIIVGGNVMPFEQPRLGISSIDGNSQQTFNMPNGSAMPLANENEIKVMLDGKLLRVSAIVDLRGARKLMKALAANISLLEDDSEET
jgi:hypothetical protein